MYKVINEQEGFAIINNIDKRSIFWVPNGHGGKIRPYTLIDAVTVGNSKKTAHTFALLEHDELGEDDCIVVMLPENHHAIMMIREDHTDWRESDSAVAYFIPASRIIVSSSYNGLDDLEDENWDLEGAQYWTDAEINDK